MTCNGISKKGECVSKTGCAWTKDGCARQRASSLSAVPTSSSKNVSGLDYGNKEGDIGAVEYVGNPDTSPVLYSCDVEGYDKQEGFMFIKKSHLNSHRMTEKVADHVRGKAGAPADSDVKCSHHVIDPRHSDQWLKHKMAPNCEPYGYDMKAVTSYNKFTCRYSGTGRTDDSGNKKVHRPGYEVKGVLPSCDGPAESYGKIPDEVMYAVKRLACEKAGCEDSDLDPEQFQCNVFSAPYS